MAKVINISDKLSNEKTYIEIAEGKQYEVNKNYKNLMKATSMLQGENVDYAKAVVDAIELLLGKEARDYVEDMTIENIVVIFKAVLAAAQDTSFEDIDARFQQQS